METLKPLHLSVTLRPTPLRFPFARKAEFCIDRTISLPVKIKDGDESIEARSIGYRFIKYSGDLYSVEQEGLNLESIANEVLSLITPARKLNKEEMEFLNETSEFSCWLGLDDLDPEEVAEFLTKFGMVGLGNYSRRAALNQISNPRDFIQSVGISEKYLPVIEKEFESDPRSLRKRISKIYNGDEIPFKWIEDDLRTLARCIRLIVALDQNSKDWWKKGEIVFKRDKNLRRIIHAWSPIFAIPDYKDPGQYLPTNSKWLHINPNNILEDFVSKINRFLLPISQNAVLTKKLREIQDRNFGLETALSSYLFLNKTKGLYQITCKYEKCGKLHFPERNTKVFCSTTCGTNDRVSRKRERDKNKKKVSAAKAGSKATPKARKEKK